MVTLTPGLLAHRDDIATQIDYILAERQFIRWLAHVKILEPPPGVGILPWQPWPHLSELAAALTESRFLVILKARQIGISWLLAAYALWTVVYHKGAVVLLISKGEREAGDLLGKCKFIYDQLPDVLRPKAGAWTASEANFTTLRSKIVALPSTEGAGRSETASLVIQDEADHHEHLDANYAAIKPTIDAGGQLIQASTPDKRKVGSLFKGLYRGAPGNGFQARFYGWQSRPGRDAAWYAAIKASVPSSSGMSPDLYMEQEYPSTAEEALAPSQAVAFFDRNALVAMLEDCREPVEMRQGGLVRIWRKPVVAGRYVAFGDCAWGEKGAYSCLVIADWQTGEQVAEVYGRPTADEAALANVKLCREYNDAYCGVEENGEGKIIVKKMHELGYGDRMYCRTPTHADKDYRSWLTDSSTRPVMLGELEEAVRMRRIVVRCREAIAEMMQFIRTEEGRPEAAAGAYADHIMAWAGVWQMRSRSHYSAGASNVTKIHKFEVSASVR